MDDDSILGTQGQVVLDMIEMLFDGFVIQESIVDSPNFLFDAFGNFIVTAGLGVSSSKVALRHSQAHVLPPFHENRVEAIYNVKYRLFGVGSASSADASCFSKTPPCPTLKNGRQPAKRLSENVRFTASLLRLAASNSSSEYISQTTKNSREILKQLDSQGISFFKLIFLEEALLTFIKKPVGWGGLSGIYGACYRPFV